jgi:glycerol-3-phosphate acyltransferase PlsX
MKIIIDAMGGDNAPAAVVKGAVDAQLEFGIDLVLVGREAEVRSELAKHGAAENAHIAVVNADSVIDMHDDPAMACRRKKDSSMTIALRLLADGEGDAMISAGSTGALLTGATLIVKRVHGIRRAAFAPVLPNGGKGVVLIDCGANVECTPEYLLQFGFMGSYYSHNILGCADPRVGLLNNGSEDTKGTALCKEAYALLKAAGDEGRLNFIGNVEGTDVFSGKVDVIVTDGYTGNILLKTVEGTAKFLMKNIKGILTSSLKTKLGALLIKKDFYALKKLFDVSEVGGTAFIGITKPVIKAHGSSDARAIRSAVRQAIDFTNMGVIEDIERNIEHMMLREEHPTE